MADKTLLAPIHSSGHENRTDLGEHLDLVEAVEYTGKSRITIVRRIADGILPSVIINRKHYVSRGDLDAVFGPAPLLASHGVPSDDSLRYWAKRMAEFAPPLLPEQRDVVLDALGSALTTVGGE